MFCCGETAQLKPAQILKCCVQENRHARIFEKYWIRVGSIDRQGFYKDFGEFTPEEVEEVIYLQDCIWNWKENKTPSEIEEAHARFKEKYSVFR